MDSPAILTVIAIAQKFRSKPSDILQMTDGYASYCFDEACCWILSQLEEGKRPFFGNKSFPGERAAYGNSQTIDMLRKLGAEVKTID